MSDILSSSNVNAGLVIDPVTRKISAKDGNEKLFVAKNDHNSTVLSFEIPKYIDGHDMSSEDTFIHIHFVNMDAENNAKTSGGVCDVTATALESAEGVLSFSWCIPRIATRYAGVLSVGVTFECYENSEGEAEEVYSWSSAPYGDIVVCNSIDKGKEETEREYSYLVETCNAIVMSALKADLSYLVDEALETAKDSGEFDGAKGDKGDGWVVRGYYTTLDKLKVSVDFPVQGDTYAVGKKEPYTYYTYDAQLGWVSQGTFSPVLAESYARGGTGTRKGEDSDNAKFYYEKTKDRFDSTANTYKTISSGKDVVIINDVSPYEHDMTVTVTSPYLIPIVPYDFDDAEEIGGVHADVKDDGSVIIKGICNSEETRGKYVVLKKLSLKTGYYTVALRKSSTSEYLEIAVGHDAEFNTPIAVKEGVSGEQVTVSFNLTESQEVYLGVKTQFAKGETYELTFKPKLYLGKSERFDLSEIESIDIIDIQGNVSSYPCNGKASDTSVKLTVKSVQGRFKVKTDNSYSCDIAVEYNADTNNLDNKFSQPLYGFEENGRVIFLDNVSEGRHFVTVTIPGAYTLDKYGYFTVYGTNLLNIDDCVVNNGEIQNSAAIYGAVLRSFVDTHGIEIVVGGALKEILSIKGMSRRFTFSAHVMGDEEYLVVRILYKDGSEDEFVGEKGSRTLTFDYTSPIDKTIDNIYLYPRTQDELFTVTKTTTGIQFEIGQASSFCTHTSQKYDLFEGRSEENRTKEDCECNIPAIAPKMAIVCNENTTVNARYKKDLNKVIEDLQNAILSLGGNI
ncbi:MAG: hypothetical protein IJ323_04255 [Clostridia bacterium]|nr:hypothetical protein [Clostridia bacterium]